MPPEDTMNTEPLDPGDRRYLAYGRASLAAFLWIVVLTQTVPGFADRLLLALTAAAAVGGWLLPAAAAFARARRP